MTEELSSPAAEPAEGPLFSDFDLPAPVLQALSERGYEQPTPIQAGVIPPIIAGRDVIGQAQTGTGKTAAFAIPLLSKLDPEQRHPQVLVLTPTRELANQVASAVSDYAKHLRGVIVASIYGGAPYGEQLRALRRGAQVVIGTPGRIMDHLQKGSLNLSQLTCLVLDEADEMLRMGFIEDVEWILEHAPVERQTTLFSATMPKPIARIAERYLDDPCRVTIKAKAATANTIDQAYWFVRGLTKDEALIRFIEAEADDGVMIFARTKAATTSVADHLQRHGISAAALNGDLAQEAREKVVARLTSGSLDVVVATDVAARGLDVPRISLVINYDLPDDAETYVHRIGRTGRAGRSGRAISFVHGREMRLLRSIERHNRTTVEECPFPSGTDLAAKRTARLTDRILRQLTNDDDLLDYQQMITNLLDEHDLEPSAVAAVLAKMANGNKPLTVKDPPPRKARSERPERRERRRRDDDRWDDQRSDDRFGQDRPQREPRRRESRGDQDYYRLAVGHHDAIKPGMIVGAIANEMGIPGHAIGHIRIHDSYSTVALPSGLPPQAVKQLGDIWVAQKQLDAQKLDAPPEERGGGGKRFGGGGRRGPGGGGHHKQRGGYGGGRHKGKRRFDS
jgi:ATP-dependent RNA helicase DeaD